MAKAKASEPPERGRKNKLHIGAFLDADLVQTFRRQCSDRDFNASKLFEKFMRWFVALDRDLQIMVYHGSSHPADFHRRMVEVLEKKERQGDPPPGYEDSDDPPDKRKSRSRKR